MATPARTGDAEAARKGAAAERQRRWRKRRAGGLRVVPVEVDRDETLPGLIERGFVSPAAAHDPALLAWEIGMLLDALAAEGMCRRVTARRKHVPTSGER